MSNVAARPIPRPSPWSKPYWDAARNRRLIIQICADCHVKIMYPKKYCPACLSENLGWMDSPGRGEVMSFSVQLRSAPSSFVDKMPYVVAVIRLDEGVQLMSNIVGDGAMQVSCGDRVTVDFEPIPDSDILLPVFQLEHPIK
jgi:uncharacterized OB-fold protein